MLKNVLSIAVLLILLAGCSAVEIPKEMRHLDQAYIPVWLASTNHNLELGERHFKELDGRWRAFEEKYQGLLETSEDHREIFRLLNQWLEEAEDCIEQRDELCARIKLDHFKFELQEIRFIWEMDYTLDYLWDFEADIAQFTDIAEDPKMQLLEWSDFMTHLKAVNNSWEKLKEHVPNPTFLDWNDGQLITYQSLKDELGNRLVCLNGISESAQLEEIFACALGIQVTAHQMIALFGNPITSLDINTI